MTNSFQNWTLPAYQAPGFQLILILWHILQQTPGKKKKTAGPENKPRTLLEQEDAFVYPKVLKEQPGRRLQPRTECPLSSVAPYGSVPTVRNSSYKPCSLPPPSPLKIDFVLPVFLCLTKKAKVTCYQWTVAKKHSGL